MTNQEAAEMIRNDIKLHHDYLSGQYRKALNMAINALLKEQPDIVMCKDCVNCIKELNGDLYCDVLAVGYEPLGSKRVTENWYCADGERKE